MVDLFSSMTALQIVRSVVLGVVTLVIIVGNSLVLLVLPRMKTCKGNPRLLLTSLTIADLLAGIFVALPMTISSVADRWVLGNIFCNFIAGARLAFNIAGLLSLLAVTIDRYVAIAHPLRYNAVVTRRKCVFIVSLIWCVSVFMANVYGPIFGHIPAKYFSEHCICYFTPANVNEFDWTVVFCLTFIVVVPFLITATVYMKLFFILRKRAKFVAKFTNTQNTNIKFLTTFFLVLLYFGIAWIPYALLRFTEIATDFVPPKEVDILIEILILINNGINIFTYYFRNNDFQGAATRYLCSCMKGNGGDKSQTSSSISTSAQMI